VLSFATELLTGVTQLVSTAPGLGYIRAPLETELSLALVDTKVPIVSLAFQHTKGHQSAGDVMPLGPLGARLTAAQPELSFAHTDDFFDLGSHVIQPTDLRGRYRQAIGGVVLGAVSDHQHFKPPAQPTGLRPIGMPAMVTEPVPIEAPIPLEAAHEIPTIVPKPLQEAPGRVPGVKQHILGATVQVMAGIAQ
jgi:hypothetical protein